jgi:hypothetical protein
VGVAPLHNGGVQLRCSATLKRHSSPEALEAGIADARIPEIRDVALTVAQ